MRSASSQVRLAPSHGGHTLLLSRDVRGTEESGFIQDLQYSLATGGMKDLLCILKWGMKKQPKVKPWPSLFCSFMNHRFLLHGSICAGPCSFLRFLRTPDCGVYHRMGPEVLLLDL